MIKRKKPFKASVALKRVGGRKITLRAATRRIKPRKGKEKSISKLIKEADRLFSLKIRSKYSKDGLLVDCFTCGGTNYIRKVHCGHYLSRFYKAARWHEDNARPQCFQCNIWKKGDTVNFRLNLINEIGEARVNAVEALRNAPTKLSRDFLLSKIQELSK